MESIKSLATDQIREQINRMCEVLEELAQLPLNEELLRDDPESPCEVEEPVLKARKVTGIGPYGSRPGEEGR